MDLSGRKIGELTVLSERMDYKGETVWQCRCSCGNTVNVLEGRLLDHSVTHCPTHTGHRRRTDLTGQRFGRLVAMEYLFDDHRKQTCWNFRCDCGNEKILSINQVKWGNAKSCGCLRRERTGERNLTDLTGQRFGRLTALHPTDQREGSGSVVWECRCDCGNTAFYIVNELRCGNVRSCGCLYRETRSEGYEHREDYVDDTNLSTLIAAKKPRTDNTTGNTGVYFDPRREKWLAYLTFQKKRHYLGSYEKKEDAVKARLRAEQEFHDPVIEKHWDRMPKKRQDEYLAYLNGNPLESPLQ